MSVVKTDSKTKVIVPIDAFLEKLIFLPNGERVVLFPHQKLILKAMFTPDTYGKLPWKTIVWSAVKKSGKSSMAGFVVNWYCFSGMAEQNDEVIVTANDYEQAQGRVYKMAKTAIEMEPLLKNECTKITDRVIELKTGTTIIPIANDYAGAAGSNPSITTWDETWGLCCFDIDSPNRKVLSKYGWLHPDEVTLDTELATLNKQGFLEYQKPTALNFHDFDGELLQFKHRRCLYRVTPNHKIYAAFADNGEDRRKKLNDGLRFELLEARFAKERAFGWLKQDCDWTEDGKNEIEIEGYKFDIGDFCELLGWYLSEGSVGYRKFKGKDKKHYGAVVISQYPTVNRKKYESIYELVKRMGLNPHRKDKGIVFYSAKLARWFKEFGKSEDKFIPFEFKQVAKRHLLRLLTSLVAGDGYITPSGIGFQYYTVSKQLAYDIIEIGMKCGLNPRLMQGGLPAKIKKPHHFPRYRVSLSMGNLAWERRLKPWSNVNYKGRVWCPTLPNGNFYMMYDGYCMWTGNSEASRRLWEELIPPPTRPNAFRFISSYAGFSNSDNVLKDIYDYTVKPENLINIGKQYNYAKGEWEQIPLYVKGDTIYYNTNSGNFPWQTKEYYSSARESPGFRLSAYLRIHENRWVDAEEGIDMSHWNSCKELGKELEYFDIPEGTKKIPLAVGVDASLVKDRAAVVTTYKMDGKIWLGPWRTWQPSKANPLKMEDTIEKYILELAKKFHIQIGYYDPWQFQRSADTLRAKGLNFQQFPQSQPNTIKMSEYMLDTLRERRLVLPCRTPALKDLEDEVKMTTVKEVPGRGRRFVKDSSSKKIDTFIALTMAVLAAGEKLVDIKSLQDQMFFLRIPRRNLR